MTAARETIDGAISLASQIREKKNQLIKSNSELFNQIRQLDDMLRIEMNKIYNSPDLEEYDILTINQALGLNDISNKPIKLSVSDKDSQSVCYDYYDGRVSTFFIDTEDLSSATKLGYRESVDKSIVTNSFWVSDGQIIRYWIFDSENENGYFDDKYLDINYLNCDGQTASVFIEGNNNGYTICARPKSIVMSGDPGSFSPSLINCCEETTTTTTTTTIGGGGGGFEITPP